MTLRGEIRTRRKTSKNPAGKTVRLPHPHDWRTTDEEEIQRRRLRAQSEALRVLSVERSYLPFSNFQVERIVFRNRKRHAA